jgi:peptidyl-prolyl cis-trans isomerase D
LASREDSASAYNVIAELKEPFRTDSNAKVFVARNSSSIEYKDDFSTRDKLSATFADTLSKLSVGEVFGPYIDKDNYVLAKMISTKQLSDSATASHILIGVNDPRTGQPIMEDSLAKKLADSINLAIKGGANFAEMAMKYSTDASNKDKAGDLGTFEYGKMVPEFNEFCFTKTPGSTGVVKTDFGYHIINLVGQKGLRSAYKIAYQGKEISASDVTINKSSLEATKASALKTKESLEKFIAKNGMSFTTVPNLIKENDYQVGTLQDARALVRWSFEGKKGDISEPFSIGDQFIVAVLDKINEKGVQDAATAKSGCESTIRNIKKAAIIKKKLGATPTLESTASSYGKVVQVAGADSSITFNAQIINSVGMEAKVIGASFNKSYQTKASPLIEGTTGVFIIKVNAIQNKPAETPEAIVQQITSKIGNIRSQTNGWYEGLKKQADIVDERSKHF